MGVGDARDARPRPHRRGLDDGDRPARHLDLQDGSMTDEIVEELEPRDDALTAPAADFDVPEESEAAEADADVDADDASAELAESAAPVADAVEGAEVAEAEEAAEIVDPDRKWYVIHTYSGYENKVKANLERRIKSM